MKVFRFYVRWCQVFRLLLPPLLLLPLPCGTSTASAWSLRQTGTASSGAECSTAARRKIAVCSPPYPNGSPPVRWVRVVRFYDILRQPAGLLLPHLWCNIHIMNSHLIPAKAWCKFDTSRLIWTGIHIHFQIFPDSMSETMTNKCPGRDHSKYIVFFGCSKKIGSSGQCSESQESYLVSFLFASGIIWHREATEDDRSNNFWFEKKSRLPELRRMEQALSWGRYVPQYCSGFFWWFYYGASLVLRTLRPTILQRLLLMVLLDERIIKNHFLHLHKRLLACAYACDSLKMSEDDSTRGQL